MANDVAVADKVRAGELTPITSQLLVDLFADDVSGGLRAVADFFAERFPELGDCPEDLRRWAGILDTIRLEAGVETTDEIKGIDLPIDDLRPVRLQQWSRQCGLTSTN